MYNQSLRLVQEELRQLRKNAQKQIPVSGLNPNPLTDPLRRDEGPAVPKPSMSPKFDIKDMENYFFPKTTPAAQTVPTAINQSSMPGMSTSSMLPTVASPSPFVEAGHGPKGDTGGNQDKSPALTPHEQEMQNLRQQQESAKQQRQTMMEQQGLQQLQSENEEFKKQQVADQNRKFVADKLPAIKSQLAKDPMAAMQELQTMNEPLRNMLVENMTANERTIYDWSGNQLRNGVAINPKLYKKTMEIYKATGFLPLTEMTAKQLESVELDKVPKLYSSITDDNARNELKKSIKQQQVWNSDQHKNSVIAKMEEFDVLKPAFTQAGLVGATSLDDISSQQDFDKIFDKGSDTTSPFEKILEQRQYVKPEKISYLLTRMTPSEVARIATAKPDMKKLIDENFVVADNAYKPLPKKYEDVDDTFMRYATPEQQEEYLIGLSPEKTLMNKKTGKNVVDGRGNLVKYRVDPKKEYIRHLATKVKAQGKQLADDQWDMMKDYIILEDRTKKNTGLKVYPHPDKLTALDQQDWTREDHENYWSWLHEKRPDDVEKVKERLNRDGFKYYNEGEWQWFKNIGQSSSPVGTPPVNMPMQFQSGKDQFDITNYPGYNPDLISVKEWTPDDLKQVGEKKINSLRQMAGNVRDVVQQQPGAFNPIVDALFPGIPGIGQHTSGMNIFLAIMAFFLMRNFMGGGGND